MMHIGCQLFAKAPNPVVHFLRFYHQQTIVLQWISDFFSVEKLQHSSPPTTF